MIPISKFQVNTQHVPFEWYAALFFWYAISITVRCPLRGGTPYYLNGTHVPFEWYAVLFVWYAVLYTVH